MLLVSFCLPETRYQRSTLALNGQVCYTDEFGVTHIVSPTEAEERFGVAAATPREVASSPKITYLQSLNPVSGVARSPVKLALGALAKMALSLSSPAVLWVILATSISLGKYKRSSDKMILMKTGTGIAMSLTHGSLLTESFGWSANSTGLINVCIPLYKQEPSPSSRS